MRLLVVDDDPDFRSMIEQTAPAWLELVLCGSSREALEMLGSVGSHGIDLALIDLHMEPLLERMPDTEGLGLIRWMRDNHRGIPVIVVSAHGRWTRSLSGTDTAVVGFLGKPLDLDRLYRFCGSFSELFDKVQRGAGEIQST